MKIYGSLFAQPDNAEQPLVFIPADKSASELILINEMPPEVAKQISDQGDLLGLAPLGVIVDLTGAK